MLEWATRVIWLDHGRVREDGPAREVMSHYLGTELDRPDDAGGGRALAAAHCRAVRRPLTLWRDVRRAARKRRPASDTSIATYRGEAGFHRPRPSPRPAKAERAGAEPIFVVQKHDASRLHYDFRLEHGGVLWSWAVPRGPSLDPEDKRLAVHVEDHPIDYAEFEGTIPPGQYGGGMVELWDRGTWAPVTDDPAADLGRGEMKFTIAGRRLHGRFVLIRLKPRPKERQENWLLIKEHDEHERPGVGVDQLSEQPAALNTAKRDVKPIEERPTVPSKPGDAPPPARAKGCHARDPGAATRSLTKKLPGSAEWFSEIKFDGYRC